MRGFSVAVSLLGISLASTAWAGSITPGAFVNPVVDDFTGLGLPVNNTGPLTRPEGTYSFSPVTFRYFDTGGTPFFHEAIGTDFQTGYIDVTLAQPTLRAGMYLGASSGTVDFFDTSNTLLGTENYTGSGMNFYGWEATSGLIGRVRVTDTNAQDGAITLLDNFTTEAPEPAAAGLVILSMSGLLTRRVCRGN